MRKPKIILTASCGIEAARVIPYKPLLDQAIEMATHKPAHCVVLQRPQSRRRWSPGRDFDWDDALTRGDAGRLRAGRSDRSAVYPLHLRHHGHSERRGARQRRPCRGAEVEHDERLQHRPGRGVLGGSDIGWTVGHGYIVYGPLLHGATTILYEGKPVGTPDAGAFWRVCEQHGVNVLFTAPTAFRAIKREDPEGRFMRQHDLSRFRLLFLAGERCDPDTLIWARERLGVPVIDHWWQTELGWPAIANCAGLGMLPIKPGSPTWPVPGYDIRVLTDDGDEAAAGADRQAHDQTAAAARIAADVVAQRRGVQELVPGAASTAIT